MKFFFVHIPKTAGVSVFLTLHDLLFDIQGKWPFITAACQQNVFCGHQPAWQLIEDGFIEPDYFEDAIVFCSIRNAWKRAVSLYFHFDMERKGYSFEEYISGIPQDEKTYHHGREQVFWLRGFDHFWPIYLDKPDVQGQFDRICKLIGIAPRTLRRENVGKNYSCTAKQMYERNPGARNLVAEVYRKDIAMFNQSFPF